MDRKSPRIEIKQNTLEWRVLNFMEEMGGGLLGAWLPKNYAQSQMLRIIFGLDKKRRIDEKDRQQMRRLISFTLRRLSSKGLIQKRGRTRGAKWQISQLGGKLLHDFSPIKPLAEDGRIRIIVFDIPESNKYDRYWLRGELIAAGFAMLQKSVWVGKRPLPENLFRALEDRKIFEAVHIFEVKESGTLQNLHWSS